MDDEVRAELESHRLREPCKYCGSVAGRIDERNGQACVFCQGCNKHLYNAPKHERGLAPTPTRTSNLKPSERYDVMERAGFRCEFCGRRDGIFHVAHLVSEEAIRKLGGDPVWAEEFENLAWACDECNLGMGKRSFSPHRLLIWWWKRHLDGDRNR